MDLKTIYNATISLPIEQRINPTEVNAIKIFPFKDSKPYHVFDEKVTFFCYNLLTSKYRYDIVIYKNEPSKLFGFLTKKETYILKIQIKEKSKFSETFKNEYFFDNKTCENTILKDLFDFLIKRNIELKELEESKLSEKYIDDLSKSVDKSVLRDETLDKLLNSLNNKKLQ